MILASPVHYLKQLDNEYNQDQVWLLTVVEYEHDLLAKIAAPQDVLGKIIIIEVSS